MGNYADKKNGYPRVSWEVTGIITVIVPHGKRLCVFDVEDTIRETFGDRTRNGGICRDRKREEESPASEYVRGKAHGGPTRFEVPGGILLEAKYLNLARLRVDTPVSDPHSTSPAPTRVNQASDAEHSSTTHRPSSVSAPVGNRPNSCTLPDWQDLDVIDLTEDTAPSLGTKKKSTPPPVARRSPSVQASHLLRSTPAARDSPPPTLNIGPPVRAFRVYRQRDSFDSRTVHARYQTTQDFNRKKEVAKMMPSNFRTGRRWPANDHSRRY